MRTGWWRVRPSYGLAVGGLGLAAATTLVVAACDPLPEDISAPDVADASAALGERPATPRDAPRSPPRDADDDELGAVRDAAPEVGGELAPDAGGERDATADAVSDAEADADAAWPAPDAATPDGGPVPDASAPCTTPSGVPVLHGSNPNPFPRRNIEFAFLGSGFTPCSVVQMFGTGGYWIDQPTTFVSPTELHARKGLRIYYAVNWYRVRSPDGASQEIEVISVPVAVISKLTPASVPAGSATFRLTITADGTAPDTDHSFQATKIQAPAKVYWNTTELLGAVYTGSYGDDVWHNVTVDVPASLVAAPGTAQITVANPGVAVSAPFAFTIL